MTRVITIDTPPRFDEALEIARELLQKGELAAVPTETVYGLAANALDEGAVRRIYEAKGRPAENPVIVHVGSLEQARACVANWPPAADTLARAFWPGPLTLVLERSERIPDIVTAGGETVGIRWPSHPFMLQLIRRCGFPLAAPSANPANQISPTTAAHVLQGLSGRIPLIVDAGPSPVGIESTVVDVSSGRVRILRPGMISAEQIRAATGQVAPLSGPENGPLKSPGLLKKHYAPRGRVMLAEWAGDADLRARLSATGVSADRIHVIAHAVIPSAAGLGRVSVIPNDAEAYARALYAELHTSDEQGAELIVIENPPSTSEWAGIRDRLTRASA